MPKDLFNEKEWKEKLKIKITYFDLLCIVGNLVLSLQHPENNGPSSLRIRQIGAKFAKEIFTKFGDSLPPYLINEWIDEGFLGSNESSPPDSPQAGPAKKGCSEND